MEAWYQMEMENVLKQAIQLPISERLQLIERLAATLRADISRPKTDWHTALRTTYGILADDPIERPPQLPIDNQSIEILKDG